MFDSDATNDDALMNVYWGGTLSRRNFVKAALAVGAATAFASMDGKRAYAAGKLTWPDPFGESTTKVGSRTVLTCYAPSTVCTGTELLGLNNPSYYANEYNQWVAADYDYAKAPLLGIWGSPMNAQPNAYLSNLIYKVKDGGTVDDTYVAVLGSALQGSSQASSLDESGVPLFMKHRPEMLAIDKDEKYNRMGAAAAADYDSADYIKMINGFKESGSEYYQEGDENYDPVFVNMRLSYGWKLGYMYDLWKVTTQAEKLLAADPGKTARYGAPADQMARMEQFMLASQYAVLRAIDEGTTVRKKVAVIGGLADQYQDFAGGVDAATGRIRLDGLDASNTDYDKATQWGSKNTNVRYYHASAALESICDSIIDVVGYKDVADKAEGGDELIVRDEIGVYWAKPEVLLECDALVMRTSTTVSTIPDTGMLYEALRGVEPDEGKWPPIHTGNPVIGGMGASSISQLFWWYSWQFFVYPEVINPVHMSAYLITQIYHVASSGLSDAMSILCSDMSLPAGVQLSTRGFKASKIEAVFAAGLEWYLSRKDEVDAKFPNLKMTDEMAAWLTADRKEDMDIDAGFYAPRRLAGEDKYESMAAQVASAFESAETIVVASGESFQAAVLATPLAGLLGAPVVTVPKKLSGGRLPFAISNLIAKLGAKRYLIVGSTSAVPAAVETALKDLGLKALSSRVTASSSAALSVAVHKKASSLKKSWGTTAIVVSGSKFAGGVCVASYAYKKKFPIFTVGKTLSSAQLAALKAFKKVILVGSTSDVAAKVNTQINKKYKAKSVKKSITRWSASSAAALGLAVAKKSGLSGEKAAFVSASSYAEALAAGCTAGKNGAVILPVAASSAAAAAKYAKSKNAAEVYIYGSADSVNAAVYAAVQAGLA